VATTFVSDFDRCKVKIRNLIIRVTYDFISKATELPMDYECWFKNQIIVDCNLNKFLKPEYPNPSWGKGIERSQLKDEWNNAIKMVQ
jgi:hypothetical protein